MLEGFEKNPRFFWLAGLGGTPTRSRLKCGGSVVPHVGSWLVEGFGPRGHELVAVAHIGVHLD